MEHRREFPDQIYVSSGILQKRLEEFEADSLGVLPSNNTSEICTLNIEAMTRKALSQSCERLHVIPS